MKALKEARELQRQITDEHIRRMVSHLADLGCEVAVHNSLVCRHGLVAFPASDKAMSEYVLQARVVIGALLVKLSPEFYLSLYGQDTDLAQREMRAIGR